MAKGYYRGEKWRRAHMATVRFLEWAGWAADPKHDDDRHTVMHKDGKVIKAIRTAKGVVFTGVELVIGSAVVTDYESSQAAIRAIEEWPVIN